MEYVDRALLDIADAAEAITLFVRGMSREDFLRDLKTQSAVLYQLSLLCEATQHLNQQYRALPWSCIVGLKYPGCRYGDVEPQRIWRTVTREVPDVLTWVQPLLTVVEDASAL
ncbi:MAG: DUF86 domain-containing protein [Anaerolineales bacterium]